MSKALKNMLATQLESDLQESTGGILVVDLGPMTVESSMAFRRDLREQAGGATLRVIHNRTAKVALKSLYGDDVSDELAPLLTGSNAVVYGGEGPIPIAKVVRDWRKKHKPLTLKAAVADGEFMGPEEATTLADMPDLPQLKAMILSAIIGSARGIATSLSAVYGGLARVIQARLDLEDGGFASGEAQAEATPEPAEAPAEEAPAQEAAGDEPAEDTPAEASAESAESAEGEDPEKSEG